MGPGPYWRAPWCSRLKASMRDGRRRGVRTLCGLQTNARAPFSESTRWFDTAAVIRKSSAADDGGRPVHDYRGRRWFSRASIALTSKSVGKQPLQPFR